MPAFLTPTLTLILVLLELGCLAGMIAIFRKIIRNYPTLPDRVPSHFGFTGMPDGWMGRGILWFCAIFTVVMYGILTFAASTIIRHPEGVHGLSRPVTPELIGQLTQVTVVMFGLMKLEFILFFGYVVNGMIAIARGEAARLSAWLTPAFLLVFLGTAFGCVGYIRYVIKA